MTSSSPWSARSRATRCAHGQNPAGVDVVAARLGRESARPVRGDPPGEPVQRPGVRGVPSDRVLAVGRHIGRAGIHRPGGLGDGGGLGHGASSWGRCWSGHAGRGPSFSRPTSFPLFRSAGQRCVDGGHGLQRHQVGARPVEQHDRAPPAGAPNRRRSAGPVGRTLPSVRCRSGGRPFVGEDEGPGEAGRRRRGSRDGAVSGSDLRGRSRLRSRLRGRRPGRLRSGDEGTHRLW